MADSARPPQASLTTLRILRLLERHFAHGLTNSEIAQATGIGPSVVIHHVAALDAEGYAERIPETGRIRPSVRYAQAAIQIQNDLNRASLRYQELQSRIDRN